MFRVDLILCYGGAFFGRRLIWLALNDLLPSKGHQFSNRTSRVCHVLSNQLACFLAKYKVNLFQTLPFCLGHEQDLVEPAKYCNGSIEADRQSLSKD